MCGGGFVEGRYKGGEVRGDGWNGWRWMEREVREVGVFFRIGDEWWVVVVGE